jgi:hypothetical protein
MDLRITLLGLDSVAARVDILDNRYTQPFAKIIQVPGKRGPLNLKQAEKILSRHQCARFKDSLNL